MVMLKPQCVECGKSLEGSSPTRKYCSQKCKRLWRKKHGPKEPVKEHDCRMCGKSFPIGKGQANKWLCSEKCRKDSNAKSVREFHLRQPEAEARYRSRTKAKRLPEGNLVRFRRTNPDAPTACESCGEHRVLDVAHKPGHVRLGSRRSAKNCKWPEMVWVLCPTCHALIDRMNYPPEELGLSL